MVQTDQMQGFFQTILKEFGEIHHVPAKLALSFKLNIANIFNFSSYDMALGSLFSWLISL